MRPARTRIVLLGLAVGAVAVLSIVYWRQSGTQPASPTCDTCCVVPASPPEAPAIPDASGLPCLVAFQIAGTDAAALMDPVLQQFRADAKGRLAVITVDPDSHPALAAKWRLRIAPTQVLVSAEGKELWRHEGPVDPSHLKAEVAKALR